MKVLHFVTGGFSGATKVAVDLIAEHNQLPSIENLLVLRRKSTTVAEKLKELDEKNIEYRVITGSTHITTILELKKLCEQWQPDILVAHGFPEHLLGRRAGLLAKVPHLIQVEHNSKERYTPWKLYQTRKLSKHTDRVVAVSQGVAKTLSNQDLKAPIQVISNGIDTMRFGGDNQSPISDRPQDLIMVGRYAKSKDHITLVEAMHELKEQGVIPHLMLVGTGRERYKKEVMQLVQQYALEDQVQFIDYSNEVDKLLLEHKVFVMSSRFEGLNLAVLEAMASGCLVIGSEAVGVEELINHEKDGFLFPIGDASKLAATIASVLSNPADYQQLASAARQKALSSYSKDHVTQGYHELFEELLEK
ncbi:glycosyltransferase family 4 protein [Psychrobacter sp. DAB_AL62B]|uniref:glycosyltransferase family 4 protein n=1 Tax=Psychrobacter sp. DAB_AL62B TaxID=1028420 RepID=UPI002380E3C5|nr:glycosyltransferase family 4 protein [Psychrobacter sp. DAB_AL62B]MDE4453838.1 glycosyltransferase [Psychrobacter sp. DAB_AL62B]